MANGWKKLVGAMTLLFVGVGLSPQAVACTVCFGDPDSVQGKAIMLAVTMMLGATVAVLAGVATFAVYFWRRAAALEEGVDSPEGVEGDAGPIPEGVELTHD